MSIENPSNPTITNSTEVLSDASGLNRRWLGVSLFWRIFLLQILVAIPVVRLMPIGDEFIRLKPSAMYFAMVFVLVFSALVAKPCALFFLWGARLGLTITSWRWINWLLVGYYVAMAVGNIILVFTTSIEAWIQIKSCVPIASLIAVCLLAPSFMRRTGSIASAAGN
ncbi:hypothetical protein GJ699_19970 [Duganella sp. FT80W]|uniref:Uncharacterized protein n=1 Tax=Duganella guangzhouensis TaxID=2666084 RepID=A0A6I2L6I0_9BURK|nr:septation protein IspZ [Duganella guangzhouensis]MRW92276.1 hypothetical protein [Duganella guangzhouensis]